MEMSKLNGSTKEEEEGEEEDEEGVNIRKRKSSSSPIYFLVIFCTTCVLQGSFHTYFVAIITSLEKLLNIPSATIGALMMATEVGQVTSSLVLPYYATHRSPSSHPPRWMGFGSLLFASATLLCATPHLLIDVDNHSFNTSSGGIEEAHLHNLTGNFDLCSPPSHCNGTEGDGVGGRGTGQSLTLIFGLIFTCLFLIGVGQSTIFTLGIPYLDDNVGDRKDSAVYFAITIGIRILGPVAGFALGSLCTRLYVNPFSTPEGLSPSSPHWIGAWWLGMLFISVFLFITSFFMCTLPRINKEGDKDNKKTSNSFTPPGGRVKGNFLKTLRRLLSNKLLVLRTFSSVFHLLPIAGLYTFLPKYLESAFQLPSYMANLITGTCGILIMGVGIFSSGFFIRRKEPTPKSVALWVAVAAGVWAAGMGLLTFIPNENQEINPITVIENGCSSPFSDCSCHYDNLICGDDGMTYASACGAGCTSFSEGKFRNCSCLSLTTTAIPGSCTSPHTFEEGVSAGENTSNMLWLYLTIFTSIALIHSTSEVPSMLLTLRSVKDPKDKAMALGLIQVAIGVLGNVPCPVVYGGVVDMSCKKRSIGCGGPGHCVEYDNATFRIYFHGLTALLMSLAFVIDLIFVFAFKGTKEDNQGSGPGGGQDGTVGTPNTIESSTSEEKNHLRSNETKE